MKNNSTKNRNVTIYRIFTIILIVFIGSFFFINYKKILLTNIPNPQTIEAVQGTLIVNAESSTMRANKLADGSNISYFVDPAGAHSEFLNPVGIGLAAGTSATYSLQITGNLYASGSSRDYKMNIEPMVVDTTKLYNLEAVSYDYKPEYSNKGKILGAGKQVGLIAEDVYKIIPELAVSDGKEIRNVDYEKLPVLMLVELQKHEKKIIELEAKIKELEAKIK
jgi:hypothetical protein